VQYKTETERSKLFHVHVKRKTNDKVVP